MDIYLKNFHELLHHPESMCFGTHENIREQFYRRSLNHARILNQLQYFMFSGSLLPEGIWQELEVTQLAKCLIVNLDLFFLPI